MSLQAPVREGGPAGSGVYEATISAAPERLGGAALGKNKENFAGLFFPHGF